MTKDNFHFWRNDKKEKYPERLTFLINGEKKLLGKKRNTHMIRHHFCLTEQYALA